MRHSDWKHKLGLPIIFSMVVFFILIITALIMGLLTYILIQLGIFEVAEQSGPNVFFPMTYLLVISVVVGTVVSLLMSRIPLRPVRKVIGAINKLAEGDFSTRLNLAGPAEIRELGDSFNRMATELGGLEILRSDFVNNFSHEFKTPIVSISGFAEMLKHDDLPPEQRDEYLDIIISESKRLASLSTNVLNLSKIENQSILTDVTSFDISEQVRRCILVLEGKWAKKDIELSLDIDDVRCMGNEGLLNEVWINMIENAIKFSPRGGRIQISLHSHAGRISFSVINGGEQMSDDTAKHIFDKFYQGDSSHTTEGYGLGLTVCHRIVKLHKGNIICRNTGAGETEFLVELPERQ